MVGWGLIAGLVIIAWLMMWWLARSSRKRGHNPQRWQSGLVLFWAIIWALERIFREQIQRTPVEIRTVSPLQLIGIAVAISAVAYVGVFFWMWKTPAREEIWEKIDEIGKEGEEHS